jgi:hypothetical protein
MANDYAMTKRVYIILYRMLIINMGFPDVIPKTERIGYPGFEFLRVSLFTQTETEPAET